MDFETMSEPSPEAKQAAEECCEGLLDEAAMAHIIQQAIDTATAKVTQDQLDAEWDKGFNAAEDKYEQATAKLREELEQTKRCLLQMQDAAIQLAHQQPGRKPRHPMQTATNCGRCQDTKRVNGKPCPDCQPPSATTAERKEEKIAIETRNRIGAYLLNRVKDPLGRYEEEEIRELVSIALAQARAPLVEALKDAIERFAGAPDNDEDDEAAIARYRAALTGTGEKG